MKYALVTGTSHGIGLELTRKLFDRGYYVIACRKDDTEHLIDDVASNYPGQITILPLDIGDDASVAGMKDAVLNTVPCLDLLINNAGILGDMSRTVGDKLDFDEMLHVFNINALGALRVTNALAGLVTKSQQRLIINISSEAGSIQDCWREGWFGYCMSKAANNMQGTIVQNALKDKGVRVLQIHPGHVATYMRGHLDTTAKLTPDESAEAILKVVLDTEHPVTDHPPFIDYRGMSLRY